MLNINDIVVALTQQIATDSAVLAGDYRVEQSTYINMDPDMTPWIGVYKGPVNYAPGSLGRHAQSWEATLKLTIIVQAAHGGDAAVCSERLAQYEQTVLDAVWSDPTLGGLVDMITGLDIEYSYNNTESETMYHQQSIITVTAEARAG